MNKSDRELLWMLIDAIDYVYLRTDGSYIDLSPVVTDKLNYIKSILNKNNVVND